MIEGDKTGLYILRELWDKDHGLINVDQKIDKCGSED